MTQMSLVHFAGNHELYAVYQCAVDPEAGEVELNEASIIPQQVDELFSLCAYDSVSLIMFTFRPQTRGMCTKLKPVSDFN
jgi:hypothetical protein